MKLNSNSKAGLKNNSSRLISGFNRETKLSYLCIEEIRYEQKRKSVDGNERRY